MTNTVNQISNKLSDIEIKKNILSSFYLEIRHFQLTFSVINKYMKLKKRGLKMSKIKTWMSRGDKWLSTEWDY